MLQLGRATPQIGRPPVHAKGKSVFIALRQLNTKDGRVNPGDAIPSAASWPSGVLASEINCGNVYDLERKLTLTDRHSPSLHKRERELLRRIEMYYGKRVVTRPDGTCEVIELSGWIPDPAVVDPALASSPEAPRKRGGRSRG